MDFFINLYNIFAGFFERFYSDFFFWVINTSISAGFLVAAIISVRLILKKAPKAMFVVLWGLVAVRLICPFSLESAISLIPSKETIPTEQFQYQEAMHEDYGLQIVTNPIYPEEVEYTMPGNVESNSWDSMYAYFAWLGGMGVMFVYSAVSYVILKRKVRVNIHYKDNIFLCDGIRTPFILGVFKPKIYLPSDISDEEKEYVIAHENAHLKRRDHWWKPLGFILLSVHWFNPLIWVAYIFLCRDIELACDEKVIAAMGETSKKAYSEALLLCSAQKKIVSACPVAFGEVGVKDRIKNILNYKKPAVWFVAATVITSVVVAICFMTNPLSNDIYGKTYEVKKCYYHDLSAKEKAFDGVRFNISENGILTYIYEGNVVNLFEITDCENRAFDASELVGMINEKLPVFYRVIGPSKIYASNMDTQDMFGHSFYVFLCMRNGDIIGACIPRGEYVLSAFKLNVCREIDAMNSLRTVVNDNKRESELISVGELENKVETDIYYFGLDSVEIKTDGEYIDLKSALADSLIFDSMLLENAEKDYILGKCEKEIYGADNYKYRYNCEYRYKNYSIIKISWLAMQHGTAVDKEGIFICAPGFDYNSLNEILSSEERKAQEEIVSLEKAVSYAIRQQHEKSLSGKYFFDSFLILKTEYNNTSTMVKVYIQYCYSSYDYADMLLENTGTIGSAAILEFTIDERGSHMLDEFIGWYKHKGDKDMELLDVLVKENGVDLYADCERKAYDYFENTQSTRISDGIYIIQNPENGNSALIKADGTEIIPWFEGGITAITGSVIQKSDSVLVKSSGRDVYVADLNGNVILSGKDYDRISTWSYLGNFEAEKDSVLYVFNSKAKLLYKLDSEEKVIQKNSNGTMLTAKYENGRVSCGVKTYDSEIIVPCVYDEITYIGNNSRILARKGESNGIDASDTNKIYDLNGNVICDKSVFTHMGFAQDSDIGIGMIYKDDGSTGLYLIDTDGNKLTEEFDIVSALSNGNYYAQKGSEAYLYNQDAQRIAVID